MTGCFSWLGALRGGAEPQATPSDDAPSKLPGQDATTSIPLVPLPAATARKSGRDRIPPRTPLSSLSGTSQADANAASTSAQPGSPQTETPEPPQPAAPAGPLKVGPLVISGHRTFESVKRRRPLAKDAVQLEMPPPVLPRKTLKLPIEIGLASPYNRFPTVEAVNREIDRIAQTPNAAELVAQVRTALAEHLTKKGPPSLVIVGDVHGSGVGLALALTLLRDCDRAGAKNLLLEASPDTVRETFPANSPIKAEFGRRLQADRPMRYAVQDPAIVNQYDIGLYAQHLGYELQGFDPLQETAKHQEAREKAMVDTLAKAVAQAPLSLVVVGIHHVPVLHEKLSRKAGTFTVTALPKAPPGYEHFAKRASYLLATPEILKVHPGPALEAPLDAVNFINHTLGGSAEPQASTSA